MGIVDHGPNIAKESNENIQTAIREVSKADFIVKTTMGINILILKCKLRIL